MSYGTDYLQWTKEQAAHLRALADLRVNLPVALDLENLAEEVGDMGNNTVAVVNRLLRQALIHLLKLEFSRERYPRNHWMVEVDTFREDALLRLRGSPSLVRHLAIGDLYRFARRQNQRMLVKADADQLPDTCPYTIDQLLDPGFYPVNRHGIEDEGE